MTEETLRLPFPVSVTDCKFVVVQQMKTNETNAFRIFPSLKDQFVWLAWGGGHQWELSINVGCRDVVGSRSVIDLISDGLLWNLYTRSDIETG